MLRALMLACLLVLITLRRSSREKSWLEEAKDPYAVRTLLAWCIVGPANTPGIQTDEESLVTCNRIVAKEIGRDADDKGINFVLSEPVKELINATDYSEDV